MLMGRPFSAGEAHNSRPDKVCQVSGGICPTGSAISPKVTLGPDTVAASKILIRQATSVPVPDCDTAVPAHRIMDRPKTTATVQGLGKTNEIRRISVRFSEFIAFYPTRKAFKPDYDLLSCTAIWSIWSEV